MKISFAPAESGEEIVNASTAAAGDIPSDASVIPSDTSAAHNTVIVTDQPPHS